MTEGHGHGFHGGEQRIYSLHHAGGGVDFSLGDMQLAAHLEYVLVRVEGGADAGGEDGVVQGQEGAVVTVSRAVQVHEVFRVLRCSKRGCSDALSEAPVQIVAGRRHGVHDVEQDVGGNCRARAVEVAPYVKHLDVSERCFPVCEDDAGHEDDADESEEVGGGVEHERRHEHCEHGEDNQPVVVGWEYVQSSHAYRCAGDVAVQGRQPVVPNAACQTESLRESSCGKAVNATGRTLPVPCCPSCRRTGGREAGRRCSCRCPNPAF